MHGIHLLILVYLCSLIVYVTLLCIQYRIYWMYCTMMNTKHLNQFQFDHDYAKQELYCYYILLGLYIYIYIHSFLYFWCKWIITTPNILFLREKFTCIWDTIMEAYKWEADLKFHCTIFTHACAKLFYWKK